APRWRGLVSDDTDQTIVIARALAASRDPGAFGDAVIRGLRRWFLALPPAIGWGTLRACVKLCFGARQGVASAGNAPAMRAAILGVVARDRAHLDRLAAAATLPTHTDPRALDAARIVALAAHAPMSLVQLASACRTDELGAAIAAMAPLVGAPPHVVARTWSRGPGAFCIETVPAALWAAQRATPAAAIHAAIRLGGDTDTVAAIAGAIAGAHAPDALPVDGVARLGATGRYLARLAAALADGFPAPRRHHPLVAVPRNLAVGIVFVGHAARRALGIRPA
ncbi:MAG: ADP-ribosylglycohydrolase family protein, partial [Deltaproteobacteria bacterium]|nr:ADP-ribosylglycohydrolase family protein [Deltaproteobacteria bacterium]